MKKHGTDGKRRVWRKLHLAVDTDTHEIFAAELTLSGVTDAEVLPNLLKQTRRSIKEISGDGAYDTRECHRAIRVKKAIPLIPPREGAAFPERSSTKSGGWLPKAIWFEQKVETQVWLPQAFIVGDRYVSRKTTTRRFEITTHKLGRHTP